MNVRAATPEERNTIAKALGCALSPDARGIVAVDGHQKVRGGVLYDMWTESMVQCHMAVDTPIAWRSLLPWVFEYPFVEAARTVLLGIIRSNNERSRAMARALGFTETHTVRDGYSQGVDLVFVEMRREDCRYLKEMH